MKPKRVGKKNQLAVDEFIVVNRDGQFGFVQNALLIYKAKSFSLNIFNYSGLGNMFCNLYYPFPLCWCECCLVAALACPFSKSTRISLTCKRYGSLLTRVSHLSSPSDGLSSFSQDHIHKWCQGSAENSVPEIFIPDGNRTRNLCVSSQMHYQMLRTFKYGLQKTFVQPTRKKRYHNGQCIMPFHTV